MLRSLAGAVRCVLEPSVLIQSRNYAIAKRKLIRKEYFVYKPKMKSRYKGNPFPRLKLILLEDVENIGMKGDLVEVKRGRGRLDLIPNKLAVYATEENLNKFGIDPEKIAVSTPKVPQNVLKYLKKSQVNLVTPLLENIHEETRDSWIITKHDIAEYFHRHSNLQVPVSCMNVVDCDDDIIKETGSYVVEITINDSVTVPVALNVTPREKELEGLD